MLSANYSRQAISEDEIELLKQVRVFINRQYLPWRGEISLGERDRLWFEIDIGDLPLDIYSLTLELERDEVTQGIAVEWNVLRSNSKVSTREWQQRMQEEQYAGDCSVTLLYRGLPVPGFTSNIRLEVTRLAEQHYDFMREILKKQNEKILYSQRGRSHEISLLAFSKSAAAARYEIVLAYYGQLAKVLPPILEKPHHVLKQEISHVSASHLSALNYNSLKLASRSGSLWMAIPQDAKDLADVEALLEKPFAKLAAEKPLNKLQAQLMEAQRRLNEQQPSRPVPTSNVKLVPTRVPMPRLEKSLNTYENRFLKMTIRRFINLTKLVQGQLNQEIQTAKLEQNRSSRIRTQALANLIKNNEQYIQHLQRMIQRLENLIRNSFLATLGGLGPRQSSVIMRENRYYRQIRQIASDIETEVDLVNNTVNIENENKNVRLSSVNQLYEHWVTVVILQTMVEKLGFTVVAKEGKPIADKNRFNYILQSGGSMELASPLGRRVMIYYDREYQSYGGDKAEPETFSFYGYYAPPGMGSTKRKPDIAIEVFQEGERVPKIVILDATYSRDRRTLYAKYEYRDSIRDFTKTDAQSGTLARPVVAAWAIYPDEARHLEHDEFRYGQLPLQPSPQASDELAKILGQLLKMANALD